MKILKYQKRLLQKHYHFSIAICIVCLLALLSGCGGPANPADDMQTGGTQKNTYLTSEDVKSIALENAGLSEDEIRLTRLHLDSSDTAQYEIEFISSSMEYDYVIDAVTGEILSMNCEAGSYDLSQVPEGLASQAGSSQNGSSQEESSQDSPSQDSPSQNNPSQDSSSQGSPSQNSSSQGQNSPASQDSGQYIGTEAAQQAALSHANLKAEDVYFTHTHLEFDDGRWQYDVEFHKGNEEYDYDIDALTREILAFDHDAEYKGSSPSGTQSGEQLTQEEAKQLALAHAGISESDVQHLKIDFDYDDGRAEYEVEWHVGRTEYSCDVDAYTGEILSFKKELD